MKEFEEKIFEVLEEEYMNNDRNETDVVFGIIGEKVRIANELTMVEGLSDEKISQITELSIRNIQSIRA
jgi:translation elongation factor EF-1beta